jgi:hypothetical protein
MSDRKLSVRWFRTRARMLRGAQARARAMRSTQSADGEEDEK